MGRHSVLARQPASIINLELAIRDADAFEKPGHRRPTALPRPFSASRRAQSLGQTLGIEIDAVRVRSCQSNGQRRLMNRQNRDPMIRSISQFRPHRPIPPH